MGKENYKPVASCRFYTRCAVYNAGILREEVEKELCGKGQNVQKDYIPRIHKTYTPPTKESGSPTEFSVCPVFGGIIDTSFVNKIRNYIEQIDRFWQKGINLDDIFNK